MKSVLYAVIIVLLTIAVILAFRLSKNQEIVNSMSKASNLNSLYKSIILLQYNSESKKLNREITVRNLNNDTIQLRSLLNKNRKKLILRISENHCNICVKQEIGLIDKIIEETDTDDIIILASFDRFQKFKAFCIANEIDKHVYLLEEKLEGVPLEEADTPYSFITDSKLILDLVFVPSKDLPDNSKNYYFLIFDDFFNQRIDFILKYCHPAKIEQ